MAQRRQGRLIQRRRTGRLPQRLMHQVPLGIDVESDNSIPTSTALDGVELPLDIAENHGKIGGLAVPPLMGAVLAAPPS